MKDEKEQKSKKVKEQDKLAASRIEEYGPVKGPARNKNLSHGEVLDKLEVMSRIGKLSEEYTESHIKIQKIKERYKTEVESNQEKQAKSDIHYAQGLRSGLPHTNHESLQDLRDRKDLDHRDHIVSEAKSEYHKHVSLKRNFTQKQNGRSKKK